MNYTIKTNKFGNKYYYLNNVLHREDGPAVEYTTGTKHWYKDGLLHREDGPAIEHYLGYKAWWLKHSKYGENNDFTVESWKKFVQTIIFA